MKTFKTTDGKEWQIAVNVGTVKRCRQLTGTNLLELVSDQSSIASLFSDDVKLCEVLCAVIRPQLEAAARSDDDFFAAINGDVIEQAAEALLAEIVDFFQEPRRGLLKKALAKYLAAAEKLQKTSAAAIEAKLEEMDFEALILKTPTNSASDSQESAA